MSVIDPRTPVDDLHRLSEELRDIKDRLDKLEAPTGTSAYRTVAKLEILVADIQAALDEYNATRYNNAQIDAKDAAVAAQIQPAINATLGGNVTIGGELRVPNAYGFDITYTRRTAWWGNDGRAGYASSTQRKKTAIKPADVERLLRLLGVEPKAFRYRAEIARRTRLRINDGVDYVPPVELGLLAEDLHAAGLHEFVYYDDDGQPEGIEYSMLVVALLAIDRDHEKRIATLEAAVGRVS